MAAQMSQTHDSNPTPVSGMPRTRHANGGADSHPVSRWLPHLPTSGGKHRPEVVARRLAAQDKGSDAA